MQYHKPFSEIIAANGDYRVIYAFWKYHQYDDIRGKRQRFLLAQPLYLIVYMPMKLVVGTKTNESAALRFIKEI